MAFIRIGIPIELLRESSDTRKGSLAASWMKGRRSVLVTETSKTRVGRYTAR